LAKYTGDEYIPQMEQKKNLIKNQHKETKNKLEILINRENSEIAAAKEELDEKKKSCKCAYKRSISDIIDNKFILQSLLVIT